jgi:hypothetical protein
MRDELGAGGARGQTRGRARIGKVAVTGLVAGLLAMAAPAVAQVAEPPEIVTTPPLGGPHAPGLGYQAESRCPAGTFMTGLEGETRVVAVSITVAVARPVCAEVTGDDVGPSASVGPAMGDGAGGVSGTTRCPASQVVVGLQGRQGDFVDHVAARCRPLDPVATPTVAAPFGGNGGGPAGPFDCPAGALAVGITGEVINWNPDHVRSLSLLCASSAPDPGPEPGADGDAPTVGVAVDPVANTAGWHRDTVTVTASAEDGPSGSGIDRIEWTANGGPTTPVAGRSVAIPVAVEGETTLTFVAVDGAGNRSSTTPATVRIDRAPPTIVTSVSPAPAATGWYTTPPRVTLAAADLGSGVGRLEWSTTTGGTSGVTGASSATVTIDREGVSTLTSTAADRAGNLAAASPVTLAVDLRAPELRLPLFTAARPGARVQFLYDVTDTVDPAPAVTCERTPVTGDIAIRACRAGDAAGHVTTATTVVLVFLPGVQRSACGVLEFLNTTGLISSAGVLVARILVGLGSTLGCQGFPAVPPPLPVLSPAVCEAGERSARILARLFGPRISLILSSALANLCPPE